MPNSWICLDASLVVRLVMQPGDGSLKSQWEAWQASHQLLAAPTLLHYEVSNAIYRYRRQGLISAEAMWLAQDAMLSLPIRLYGDAALHQQALRLAQDLSLSAAYDAHYLALAERIGARFWTADKRLFNSVQGRFSWIHLWS